MDPIAHIDALFSRYASWHGAGCRKEPVTLLQHALQCALAAEWAHADPHLVAAALLHDLGRVIDDMESRDDSDDAHELRALPFLRAHFGSAVVEPIRLHVQAKRYLAAADPHYIEQLSPASRHTLRLQGGAMQRDELLAFEAHPHAVAAVALRRWDDSAKDPTRRTPSLEYYLPLLEGVLASRPAQPVRVAVGTESA